MAALGLGLALPFVAGVLGGHEPAPLFTGGDRWAVLGDSITAAGRSGSASASLALPRGYSTWADILSDKTAKLLFADNYGVSGDRTAQIAVRVPDVIASGVKSCVLLGGTNDVTDGLSAATIIANLGDMYDDLTGAGIAVIGVPILPRGGASTLTAPQLVVVNTVNAYIRSQTTRPLFRLADPVPYLEDTVTGGYVPLPGMMHDGLHPAAKGAFYIGISVAAALDNLYSPDASLDVLGALIGNPTLTGIGGTKNTLTGDVADGWSASAANAGGATVVASKRVDSAGVTWQRFTMSGTYTGTTRAVFFNRNVTAGDWLSGETGRAWARVRMSAGAVAMRPPSLQMQMGPFTSTDMNLPVNSDQVPDVEWDGILRCFDFTLPSNSVAPRILFGMPLLDTASVDPVSGWVEFAMVGASKG